MGWGWDRKACGGNYRTSPQACFLHLLGTRVATFLASLKQVWPRACILASGTDVSHLWVWPITNLDAISHVENSRDSEHLHQTLP